MPGATLQLAPHVGNYVAASDVAGGSLLAIVLAAGPRGEHRVSVLDTRTWKLVVAFPIPSRAKSGVTPIEADGEVLFANDDHAVSAFSARTGEKLWERAYPAPASVRLLAVAGGRLLVTVFGADPLGATLLLRASDGTDEASIPEPIVPSVVAPALGRDGTIVLAGMRVVDVLRAGEPKRRIDHTMKRWGMVDVAAVDERCERVVFGTRAGEVLVMDLAKETTSTVLETDACVRSVGFHRGAPWALDGSGRLRLLGEDAARASVDLGLNTYGGLLAEDGSRISLGDQRTRTFRVRSIPANEELFATTPGFACEAVGIDAAGALLVSSEEKLLRIDASTGKLEKIGGGVQEIVRLASGTLVFTGSPMRLLRPDERKAVVLAKSTEDVAVVGDVAIASLGQVAELWDLATAERTWRIDLSKTWVGETSEALRLVHLGPDGRPWIHLTNGHVFRADAFDSDAGYVAALARDGTLWVHPDGRSLYWARGRTIVPLAIEGFAEGPPLPLAVDADVAKLVFSPSGRRLVVFHRNGRLSAIDLVARRAVAVETPETSASERADGELFIVDLQTPQGCAFSRDEGVIAWTHAGGITFADALTGALAGRLVIATSGRDYVVTDGDRFDWPGAKAKKPAVEEIVVLDAGAPLDLAAIVGRRDRSVLSRLTR